MVKAYQNLELFGLDLRQELSILESRKNNQAGTSALSGGLQSKSTPKRIGSCRKANCSSSESKRTSEILSIDKRYEPSGNKGWLREYGTEARGLDLSPFYNHLSMRPSWASADALSIASRRRH
jgi:hypothetical protein